jgi:hypothetical protein
MTRITTGLLTPIGERSLTGRSSRWRASMVGCAEGLVGAILKADRFVEFKFCSDPAHS